jgi:class 3 adenylate cyclase
LTVPLVLRRIGATSNVRLACQLRPRRAVEVTPLLPPFAHAVDGRRRVELAQGSEREVAILFVDIRGFTALSEGRLLPGVQTASMCHRIAVLLGTVAAGGSLLWSPLVAPSASTAMKTQRSQAAATSRPLGNR